MRRLFLAILLCGSLPVLAAWSAELELNGRRFTLPEGMELEIAAGPPLVSRPICADFDEQGGLYVAESSGTNDNVQEQLKQRPHRILRLADTDGDGRFDAATVFADKMMFPEGVMWLDGSVYVAAPPSIWKLTDTDGDGVADRREEWFEGNTLTGCANDLHGPYRGPDGWIYWCKGAFAEQRYERPGREPFVTRAAHIFRRRPEGGPVEPVMTGGMDNPVEVVFTPGGERIFTTTFLQHPGGGLRDGLIHAVYGGVYGKIHSVIDDHPRTGDVMPVLVHLGAAAPCGLARLESSELGETFRDNVVAALFNMHKVTRHQLDSEGATFRTRDEDLLSSDDMDFHPTDVLEDADGSLIVIDTGGWYKLCCPTSQLWKPDVLGAIYRIRRSGAHGVGDPRGLNIDWNGSSVEGLAGLLGDPRPAVRRRATDALVRHGTAAAAAVARLANDAARADTRRNAVWTLSRIGTPDCRRAVRAALSDPDPVVRQVAAHCVSVTRDRDATEQLVRLLASDSPHNRRAAAEALGRLGDPAAAAALLAASGRPADRVLEHSIVFALIEIADRQATLAGLASNNPRVKRAALVALDQMPGGGLQPEQLEPWLDSHDKLLRETAAWIVDRHAEWGPALEPFLRRQIEAPDLGPDGYSPLEQQLVRFAQHSAVQQAMADGLRTAAAPSEARSTILRAMARSGLKQVPESWTEPIVALLKSDDAALKGEAITVVRGLPFKSINDDGLSAALLRVGRDNQLPDELRLAALAAIPGGMNTVAPEVFEFLAGHLHPDNPVNSRSLAADALAAAALTHQQLEALAESVSTVSPLEIERVLAAFAQSPDEPLGLKLIQLLRTAPAAASLPPDKLLERFSRFNENVRKHAELLCAALAMDLEQQRAKLDDALATVAAGDVRRGQVVFNSAKAACSACHPFGYLGGDVGPDLTRIGRIRSERDLLEAILYPSASFVRSFEPVDIITTQGLVLSGLLREDRGDAVVLVTSERKQVEIPRDQIDQMQQGKVSVMPGGLEKQLTPQELADLVAFLKAAR